jgi:hypothetical protein
VIRKLLDYRCHPFIFGLYRIAFGCTLLTYILLLSNRWIEFYGPLGFSPIKLRNEIEFFRPSLLSYVHTETGLWIYYAITVFMLVALILGRLKKLPAIFIWLTMISIQNSNSNNVNAEEFVLCIFAFYAMIMPINSTFVFNFKEKKFIDSQAQVPAWALIPFFIHIELIYIISLPLKPYFDHAWIDGTLIYFAVNTFDMSRFPGWEIFKIGHAIVSRIMTWASLLVEAAFPILIWTERFRIPVILALAAFQVGIAILLSGVQFFSLSMLSALILFLPSEKTYKLCLRIWNQWFADQG